MSSILVLIAFLSLVGLVVGLVKPALFTPLFKKQLSRGILAAIFIIIFIATAIINGIINPQKEQAPLSQVASQVPSVQKQTPLPTKIVTLAPTKAPTPTKIITPTPNLGVVTLDSLALVLVGYNISPSNDRFIGFSNHGQDNVTLIGDRNNIKTIMFSFNNQQPSDVLSNSTFIESVLQAVLPTWQGSNIWLGNALTQFSNSTDQGDSAETDIDNKHILLGYATVNSSLNLTITIK